MSLLNFSTYEHLVDENTVVSYKILKFCGIPLWSNRLESSNCNWAGQFNPDNFTANKPNEEINQVPLYTETNIGFNNHDKETKETTVQSK